MFPRLITFVSLCLLTACQAASPNAQTQRGALRISVQFPKQSFSTQLIRPETRMIYVVSRQAGQSLEQAQIYGPITPKNAQVRLNQMLIGTQVLLAAAYDQERRILTAGASQAQVKALSLSQASLELQEDYAANLSADEIAFLQDIDLEPEAVQRSSSELEPKAVRRGGNSRQSSTRSSVSQSPSRPATVGADPAATPAVPQTALKPVKPLKSDSAERSQGDKPDSAAAQTPAKPQEPISVPDQAALEARDKQEKADKEKHKKDKHHPFPDTDKPDSDQGDKEHKDKKDDHESQVKPKSKSEGSSSAGKSGGKSSSKSGGGKSGGKKGK